MSDRFDLLIEKYLEGTLSPGERGELKEMLARDDRLRAEYVARVTEEAGLRAVLGREGARAEATPRRARRIVRTARGPGLWIVGAAAAAILVVLALALTRPAPPPAPMARQEPLPTAPRPEPPAPAPRPEPPKKTEPEAPSPAPPQPPAPPAPQPTPLPPREPAPVLPPEPAPPRPPEQAPAPAPAPRAPETVSVVAKVLETAGEVYATGPTGRAPLKAGDGPLKGHGVQTLGPESRALLAFADRTRLELGPETTLTQILEAEPAARRGKRVAIAGGTAAAQVPRQEFPLVFTTPHGEATVLGTTLRIVVDPNRTRLEVTEGRVRLSSSGRTVVVTAGHYAHVGAGLLTGEKPLPRNLLVDPGFEANARGWQAFLGNKGISATQARARTGARALLIQSDGQTYRGAVQFVRVTPGETYEASVWVWRAADSGGGAELKWIDASGRPMPAQGDLPAPNGQGWVLFSDRRTAPVGAVQARFQVYSLSPNAYFDDATIIAVLP